MAGKLQAKKSPLEILKGLLKGFQKGSMGDISPNPILTIKAPYGFYLAETSGVVVLLKSEDPYKGV